jgi:hypothetical protein
MPIETELKVILLAPTSGSPMPKQARMRERAHPWSSSTAGSGITGPAASDPPFCQDASRHGDPLSRARRQRRTLRPPGRLLSSCISITSTPPGFR